jgi:SAM-dependent methyltransferase
MALLMTDEKKIIRALQNRGIHALTASGVFGRERDFLLTRSRLVLNVHYYSPAILEIVRLGYCFANKKPVVSERNKDTEIHAGYEESCIFAPYERLAERTMEALNAPKACVLQAERAFTLFSSHRYEDILEKALSHLPGAPSKTSGASQNLPTFLNAGSGKDFMREALNIDISPRWNPDIVLDLSAPLDFEDVFQSKRFGPVSLGRGRFKKIRAFDVIEHVTDLPQTMMNFMDLLDEGGELVLNVPYELSLGAWQDPTHVRAFNENSWLYYTQWAWYLGWREYRFELKRLEYKLSEFGKQLEADNTQQSVILRTPRAVDSMTATLVKRTATAQECEEYDMRHHAFYKDAVGDWTV